jgi:N-acetylglutamate synthase-like GNAT family acetyltransferase
VHWSDDVLLRTATLEDHAGFVQLHARLGELLAPPSLQEFRELAPRLLVAAAEGELLGMVAVRRMPHKARISMLAVSPKAEGRGVARRLMLAVGSRLRGENIATWGLLTKSGNQRALRLFYSLGMREIYRGWCGRAARSCLPLLPSAVTGTPRPVARSEIRKVERSFRIAGQLQNHLRHRARILLVEQGRRPVAVAGLRPDGPYLFVHASRTEAIRPLLSELWPDEPILPIFSNAPPVAEALVAAGAELLMETIEMEGPVPGARVKQVGSYRSLTSP